MCRVLYAGIQCPECVCGMCCEGTTPRAGHRMNGSPDQPDCASIKDRSQAELAATQPVYWTISSFSLSLSLPWPTEGTLSSVCRSCVEPMLARGPL